MTISESEFQQFVQDRFRDAMASPSTFQQRLKEVLDYGFANIELMDEGAKAHFDKLLETVATMFETGLASLPDSAEKRNFARQIAFTRRKHHRAENFLKGLGQPLPTPFPVAESIKPAFVETVQGILDLLFDSTREAQHGQGMFASLSMLYWTIDELNVAFYLAERKYTTQAFSHLRTVHDLLDKAELFHVQPDLAAVWGGSDKRKILKELSPGAVREKLGKPKFDPIYDFFTERGAHGTFKAVQQRTLQRNSDNGERSIRMWLGGVAWDREVDIAVACCLLSAMLTLVTVSQVYRDRLHVDEVAKILLARSAAATELLREHLSLSANEPGLTQAIETLLASTLSQKPQP